MTDSAPDTFFTLSLRDDDTEWFAPTSHSRGPWSPDACHAGPPTALLARAVERLLPDAQLTRLTVELGRPIPFAGFRIEARITRGGRSVSTSEAVLVDADGKERIRATGLHIAPNSYAHMPTTNEVVPPLPAVDDGMPGPFPVKRSMHDLPSFTSAVEIRYPAGESSEPGPTTLWMRTVALLPGETASPFQRMCPLADCGNAIGRHAELAEIGFMNADLTILLHRAPVGEWLGSRTVGRWEPTGIGMSDALLFDAQGPVGRAVQSLLLTPSAPGR